MPERMLTTYLGSDYISHGEQSYREGRQRLCRIPHTEAYASSDSTNGRLHYPPSHYVCQTAIAYKMKYISIGATAQGAIKDFLPLDFPTPRRRGCRGFSYG